MKLLLGLLVILPTVFFAQQTSTIKGKISDNLSDQPIVGAKINIQNKYRAFSNSEGFYELVNVPFGEYVMIVTMSTYDTVKVKLNINKSLVQRDVDLGGSVEFAEIEVIGNMVRDNVPIAVTRIPTQKIIEELGSRDLPMLLNGTAGVYATQQGGGDGDARINVRGFDQRNVGVMIDGVPVNDMETGSVYWSNWFGLDAITSQMQVQRGLGATKIAMPSIGGTINILTQGIGNKKGGMLKQEYSTGNMLRTTFSYNTGMTKSGWGLTVSGSYKQSDGWVFGTPSQGFFGYGKLSKKIKNHLITLSAFAAPQWHGQRSFNQAIQYFSEAKARELGAPIDTNVAFYDRGIRFNQHWGYRTNEDGEQEILSERKNFYSKPQVTLKDFWKVNDKLSISNLAYMSIGRGGGTSIFNSALLRDSSGLIDWDLVTQYNQVNSVFGTPNVDTYYHPTQIKSSQILLSSINNHFWVGYLGQFNYNISKNLEVSGGIDVRYYEGRHYQRIEDLLGGDYFINDADKNAASPMKQVGDKIAKNAYNADRSGLVQWTGAFGQVEYSGEKWSYFINLSGIVNGYKGVDYFQKRTLDLGDTVIQVGANDSINYNGQLYTTNAPGLKYVSTDWKFLPGFTFKSGISYKVNKLSNVYMNLGFLNRTPQFSNVIDNNTNTFFGEIVNEQILAAEGGYNFANKIFGVNFNAYATNWKNKPFPFGVAVPNPNDPDEEIRININGMDAVHLGGEIDIAYKVTKKLSTEIMFSYGDWFWNSSKTIFIPQYDSLEFSFDAKGVHVGDAAQTAFSAAIRYEPIKNMYFRLQGQFFDRYYANFEPFSLQGTNGGRESWVMPSYYLLNLFGGYKIEFKNSALLLNGSITNLLNSVFISDATNNRNDIYDTFDAQSATVMFGQGFRFNVSIGLQF
ncbi:MAG: TonB-dependent receptor [Crocinitomicaceae bacterium]|nr:TonB-dependent receptor [Crocinitomicaceae bacterium]MCF8409769.1 TonB-dependent receptor [Crocinitomicaceae bacterium]MCF8443473.1 TonB-dependent receptor [Crocinitomicaceae bacterium]